MVVSGSLNDDGPVVPPSPRAVMPPPSTLARVETHERHRMWEATVVMPDSTRVTLAVAAWVAPAAIA